MGRPHLLVIPYPAQGHVMPLMELSHNLVDRGFKITFVNTEYNHKRIVSAISNKGGCEDFIHLVSIPDGMEAGEDRNQAVKFITLMNEVMPGHLENLINKINASEDVGDRISFVIADEHAGWALEVAQKMSIPNAAFWPASVALLALSLQVPKLIEDGILTEDGNPIGNQMVQLSPTMQMNTAHFIWLCLGDPTAQKVAFDLMLRNNHAVKLADHVLCNSFYELEPSAINLVPNLKPIGPLFASSQLGQFWPDDSTSLSWLQDQPAGSVIYAAFGSLTVLDKKQFDELALGLELSGQPFLWVVRPDLTKASTDMYPDGFEARVGSRGRMVGWAPQREVLAHPSVGCFLTHCGWNSTMEGIRNGVPLLCCPYFADQDLNKSMICDVWKNGLGLNKDSSGIITTEELKIKVLELLGDDMIQASARKLKETAMNNVDNGGASYKNFEDFVQAIN